MLQIGSADAEAAGTAEEGSMERESESGTTSFSLVGTVGGGVSAVVVVVAGGLSAGVEEDSSADVAGLVTRELERAVAGGGDVGLEEDSGWEGDGLSTAAAAAGFSISDMAIAEEMVVGCCMDASAAGAVCVSESAIAMTCFFPPYRIWRR